MIILFDHLTWLILTEHRYHKLLNNGSLVINFKNLELNIPSYNNNLFSLNLSLIQVGLKICFALFVGLKICWTIISVFDALLSISNDDLVINSFICSRWWKGYVIQIIWRQNRCLQFCLMFTIIGFVIYSRFSIYIINMFRVHFFEK